MFNRLNNTYRLLATFVLVLLLMLITGCGGFSDDDYKRAGEEGVREHSIYNIAKLLGSEISIKSDVVEKVQDKYGRRIVVCRVKTKNKEKLKFEDWTIFVVVAPYGNKLSWERIYPQLTENIVVQFAEEIQSITKVYPWNIDPAEIEKKASEEKNKIKNFTEQFIKCKNEYLLFYKNNANWIKSFDYEKLSGKDLLKEFDKVTVKLVEIMNKYDATEKDYKKLGLLSRAEESTRKLEDEHDEAVKLKEAAIELIQKPYEDKFLDFKGYVAYVSMVYDNTKYNIEDTLSLLEKKPYSYAFKQEGDKSENLASMYYIVNAMDVTFRDLQNKKPLFLVHKGTRVKMFGQEGDWYQVQMVRDGVEIDGWIAKKYLTEQKAWEKATSFVEGNRDASSKNLTVPVEQKKPSSSDVSGISNNKLKIKVGTITGNDVNVRKGPSVDYTSLGVFFKGDKVRIVDSNTNSLNETWYKIEFDNPKVGLIVGWVRSDFININ